MKYSNTWIAVTHDARLLPIRVSPQTPMISWSWCMQFTRALSESRNTLVSASTYRTHETLLEYQQYAELSYHQADLKEIRSYTHKHMDFTEHVKVEWGHAIIISDPREEVHQDELTVALATIAGLPVC